MAHVYERLGDLDPRIGAAGGIAVDQNILKRLLLLFCAYRGTGSCGA